MKEFSKSVYICSSYDQTLSVLFFEKQCIMLCVCVFWLSWYLVRGLPQRITNLYYEGFQMRPQKGETYLGHGVLLGLQNFRLAFSLQTSLSERTCCRRTSRYSSSRRRWRKPTGMWLRCTLRSRTISRNVSSWFCPPSDAATPPSTASTSPSPTNRSWKASKLASWLAH